MDEPKMALGWSIMNATETSGSIRDDGWQRLLTSSPLLDLLAGAVDDWRSLPATEATWLTDTVIPEGWQTIPVAESDAVPLRVVGIPSANQDAWAACQTLSAFRFTGEPPPELLYNNADLGLREWRAEGIHSDPVQFPAGLPAAGARSSGHVSVAGRALRVRCSTYQNGSTVSDQGLVVEEITVVDVEEIRRLGQAIGQLAQAAKSAFTAQISTAVRSAAAIESRISEAHASGPALTDQQREFLSTAIGVWRGVASDRPLPLHVLGYSSWQEFDAEITRLQTALTQARPELSRLDWTRVLLLAEIGFASDVLGAGIEFEIVGAWRDLEALSMLRTVQRQLGPLTDAALLPHAATDPF
jgi:hypothetical protein